MELEEATPLVDHPERALETHQRRRDRPVQHRGGDGHPLPLSRSKDPEPLDRHRATDNLTAAPWRAGCGGSRTSGSASGLRKRTESNLSTAPQADSTG